MTSFAYRAHLRAGYRFGLLLSTSVLGIASAAPAYAQCAGPDAGGVISCGPAVYAGIAFGGGNPSTTIDVAPGAIVTTNGIELFGNGTMAVNVDPSDDVSDVNGGPGILAVSNVGDVTVSSGNVTSNQFGVAALTTIGNVSVVGGNISGSLIGVVAETNAGDVSINVQSVTGGSEGGIDVVNRQASGAAPGPGNVSISAGDVVAAGAGAVIDVAGADGNVNIVANTVSAANGVGIYVPSIAGPQPSAITIQVGNVTAADGPDPIGNAAIIATNPNGTVSITSGATSIIANGANPAWTILAEATGDVNITSTVATETGGQTLFNATANTIDGSGGIVAISQANVTIHSGQASTFGGTFSGAITALADDSVSITSAVASTTGPGSPGMYVVAGADVDIVSGNVATSGDTFANPGGLATAAPYFVYQYPAGAYGSDGIDAQSRGGNITIAAGNVTVTGAGANGIVASAAGTNSITVSGSVAASQGAGISLASAGASTVTVLASATVSGVVAIDATGASLDPNVGNNTAGVQGGLNVVDDGTITGTGGTAILFGSGYNTLTLGPGAVINGNIVGVVSELDGTGGTLSVPTGTTISLGGGNFSGDILGGGSLDKVGNGTLTLSGNDSFGGNVTVDSGTLAVTGNLSAPQLAVDSGATLQGPGTITGCVTVASGGTFSPGDPVTTTIFGNLLFAKGSTYDAQVTAAGAGDLIAVLGVVTINAGATFEAEPLGNPADFKNNTHYTVITATGGVVGTFSNVISEAPLLSATLIYPHDQVVLVLKRNDESFASQANTPNQAAAAAAVEAGGPDSPLYNALVGQTALGLQQGYASLSGEGYADASSTMLEQSDQTRRSLIDRMQQPAQSNGLWVAAKGDSLVADGGSNFAHARVTFGQTASGVDVTFRGWRLGFATSFGYDNLSLATRGSATLDSYSTTSAYAGYADGAFDARFGATYGWHRLASNRSVGFPGFGDADRSLTHVSSGQAFGEMGWTWRGDHGWVEPFAGLSVDSVAGFGMSEAGGPSALAVQTNTRTILTERLGVQGETTSLFGWPGVTLRGALDWRQAEGDLAGVAHLTFEGTGVSFNVHGLPIAAGAAEVTAALSAKVARNTTVDLSYHGEAGDRFSDNALKLLATLRF